MKTFLFALMFIFSCNCYANWNTEEGYKWKYDCEDPAEVTSVVFLLHEASRSTDSEFVTSIIMADDSHLLFSSLLDACALLVSPESGSHLLGDDLYRVWDYTGYFTH